MASIFAGHRRNDVQDDVMKKTRKLFEEIDIFEVIVIFMIGAVGGMIIGVILMANSCRCGL